jgi:hypothetical protein
MVAIPQISFFLFINRVYLSKETFLPRDICLIGVNQIQETCIPLLIGTFFGNKKNNVPCKYLLINNQVSRFQIPNVNLVHEYPTIRVILFLMSEACKPDTRNLHTTFDRYIFWQ